MNKALVILFSSLVLAHAAQANEDMVKQKAMQLRDANNAQQGVAPSTPSTLAGVSATPATVVPAQGMSGAQLALVERLAADVRALKTNSTAQVSLQTDLSLLAKGGTKPGKADLTKLGNDLSAALLGSKLSEKDLMQFSRDINISLNCSTLTATKTQTFITEAQTLLQNNGASEAAAKSVSNDLKGIATTIQNNKPKLYQ